MKKFKLIDIIHWIKGYIELECKNGYIERFYNLCNTNNIPFWDSKSVSKVLYAKAEEKNLVQIKDFAEKTKNELTIIKHRGLPSVIRNHKNRIGLLIGLILFLSILRLLSSFIWNIEIYGLNRLSENQVRESLKEFGIYEGKLINQIDTTLIEVSISKKNPEISWLSVNFDGTNAIVKISEKDGAPEITDATGYYNKKAKTTGKILQINTKAGTAVCKVGDGVKKGDLLISGVVESSLGFTTILHAQGEVFAETKYTVEIHIPLENQYQKPTDQFSVRKNITFLNWIFPVIMSEKPSELCHSTFTNEKIFYNNNFAPIKIKSEKITAFENENKKISLKLAQKKASAQLALKEIALLDGKEVKSRDVKTSHNEKEFIMKASYICVENICYDDKINISSQALPKNQN